MTSNHMAQMPADPGASARAPQHMQALERANDVRCGRAALKRSIAAGRTDVSEVLLALPLIAVKMALGELLMSQKYWGPVRSQRLLRAAGLTGIKTLGSLTERQRLTVAALLAADRGYRRSSPGRSRLGRREVPGR
jgi:hypothetical protein